MSLPRKIDADKVADVVLDRTNLLNAAAATFGLITYLSSCSTGMRALSGVCTVGFAMCNNCPDTVRSAGVFAASYVSSFFAQPKKPATNVIPSAVSTRSKTAEPPVGMQMKA